jgi:hypothetical protein
MDAASYQRLERLERREWGEGSGVTVQGNAGNAVRIELRFDRFHDGSKTLIRFSHRLRHPDYANPRSTRESSLPGRHVLVNLGEDAVRVRSSC